MADGAAPRFDPNDMPGFVRSPLLAIAVLLALMGVVALQANSARSAGPDGTRGSAAATASPAPATTRAPDLSPRVTREPDGAVHLRSAAMNGVAVRIEDRTGTLAGAASGDPGAGMTLRWGQAAVERLGPTTVRITWAGFVRDEEVGATLTGDGVEYRLAIAQQMPAPNTDALGHDRVLVLTFERPIAALVVDMPL
jgi:hypothetical protein